MKQELDGTNQMLTEDLGDVTSPLNVSDKNTVANEKQMIRQTELDIPISNQMTQQHLSTFFNEHMAANSIFDISNKDKKSKDML